MRVSVIGTFAERLDAFLASELKGVPRRRIAAAIRCGEIRVNGRRCKPARPVEKGDRIEGTVEVPQICIEPSDLDLDVIFEDRQIVVVNKPAGLLVQATRHESRRCVSAALLARYGDVPSLGGSDRAGIVHRLDRGVSGVLVCARTRSALEGLSRQFRDRSVRKEYWVLVEGRVREREFEINRPLALARRAYRAKASRKGKPSVTRVVVRKRLKDRTVVTAQPVTGRPHQIRAHLAGIGHPIVGDPTYGTGRTGRIALHAERLTLRHPSSGRKATFRAPVPAELKTLLKAPRPGPSV
jgi:23S rRNA pseudouridine1911/1915/1917 synthase